MFLAPIIVFVSSLTAITMLFSFKYAEERRARLLLPEMRRMLDAAAEWCGRVLRGSEDQLSKLPPASMRVIRRMLASSAISFGAIAERIAHGSHRLADFFSHKHNFERRETRSEFLRQVAEHKNGNGRTRPKIDTRE